MSHHLQLQDLNIDTATQVARLLPGDDYSISQYLLGLEYYERRVAEIFPRGDSLLDIGCGAGHWSIASLSRFCNVTGIDINVDRIWAAYEMAARLAPGKDIRFFEASVQKLPFDDACMDGVICHGMMFLLDSSHETFLREVRRVTKPGGVFYIWATDIGYLLSSMWLEVTGRKSFDPRVLIKNVLYFAGLRKQPSHWMSAGYLTTMAEQCGWRRMCMTGEPPFERRRSHPIFRETFLALPLGKEYLLRAV